MPAHLDAIAKPLSQWEWELRWQRIVEPPPITPVSRWTYYLDRIQRDWCRLNGDFGDLGSRPRPPLQEDPRWLKRLMVGHIRPLSTPP